MSGLPAGWVETTLGDFVVWGSGGTPSRSEAEYFGGTIPWVTISDLNDGIVTTTHNSITDVAVQNSSAKYVEPFSVMIALYGSIGKLGIAGTKLTTNQAIAYGLPNESFFSYKYLFYLLSCNKEKLLAAGAGVTQKNIYLSDLKAFGFQLAPRAEQTRIVAKLDALLTELDAGVAQLKAAQKKLVQYRQSLLKAAVEGTLTAEWRTQQTQPQETGKQLLERILTERRSRWQAKQLAKFAAQGKPPPKDWQSKYPEPVQPDTSELPALPQGWVWASVDQLAHVGTGVTPLRSKPAYFEQGLTPWLTSGALNDEYVSSAHEKVSDLALKECRLEVYPVGSLLVAMYGEGKTRGKCSELLIPAAINQAIAALVLEGVAEACKNYLKLFLLRSYENMREQAAGGVQPNLNLLIVRSIAVPLAPALEQKSIIEYIQTALEQVVLQKNALDTALKQSAAQRKNILKAAFAGELVPQDPSDEPAGTLLARIAAQRASHAALTKGVKVRSKTLSPRKAGA